MCIIELMPRRNIFVRNEDIEAWDTMKDRPEWLHNHIQEYMHGKVLPGTEVVAPPIVDDSTPEPVDFPNIIAGIEDADE